MYLKRNSEFSGATTEYKKTLIIKQDHDMIGSSNKYGTREREKSFIFKHNPVNMKPCEVCASVKSTRKISLNIIEHKPGTNMVARIFH